MTGRPIAISVARTSTTNGPGHPAVDPARSSSNYVDMPYFRMISPPVFSRAALNRAVASAQFTMFHQALT